MGRPPKHDREHLLDAAAALVAAGGPAAVTMSAVAKSVGAPSGSVYHRFPDRPALLAALWLRTLDRFQDGVLAAIALDPPEQAVRQAARYAVDWARDHPDEAAVLLAGARELGRSEWTESARESMDGSNAAVQTAIDDLLRRLGEQGAPATDRIMLAIVELPTALIRRYLRAGQPIPPHATELADQAAAALLS